jgi:hypothetical protein
MIEMCTTQDGNITIGSKEVLQLDLKLVRKMLTRVKQDAAREMMELKSNLKLMTQLLERLNLFWTQSIRKCMKKLLKLELKI